MREPSRYALGRCELLFGTIVGCVSTLACVLRKRPASERERGRNSQGDTSEQEAESEREQNRALEHVECMLWWRAHPGRDNNAAGPPTRGLGGGFHLCSVIAVCSFSEVSSCYSPRCSYGGLLCEDKEERSPVFFLV